MLTFNWRLTLSSQARAFTRLVKRFVIGLGLYYEDLIFKMIVERFSKEMAKTMNLSVDFALAESLNGTFKTNGREKNPLFLALI